MVEFDLAVGMKLGTLNVRFEAVFDSSKFDKHVQEKESKCLSV